MVTKLEACYVSGLSFAQIRSNWSCHLIQTFMTPDKDKLSTETLDSFITLFEKVSYKFILKWLVLDSFKYVIL